jgi:alkylation response protein AidB-like acyl-CoA dehydrogenase
MEYNVSKQDQAFRDEVREWLHANVPKQKLPTVGPEQVAYMKAWQKKQFDAGWAGISWPTEYGGRGLSLVQQVIWYEEYAHAGAPDTSCLFVGLNHGGPTLIVRGNEEQKSFHLPRILRAETLWCQGFSEPSAGSDLAGLRTRGVVDGDYLVVNGSKIWTSYAQFADYQELLVRTDPEMSKHRGITWIINDMKLPGITVRPIQAMDGEYHNCEVFYDNVRIPLANVVGQINDGWRVALSTLSFERGMAFMESQLRLAEVLEGVIELAKKTRGPNGRPLIQDDEIASQLGRLRGEVAALRAMTYMAASRGLRQDQPGPEGTYLALMLGELKQAVSRCAMEILGPLGLERPMQLDNHDWVHAYLRSFAITIGGGTSEIRRNIIGERVLGLPR